MSRRHVALTLALLATACEPPEQVELEIGTSRLGLLAEDVATLRVSLHPGENSCEVIRLSGPRIMGAYSAELAREGSQTVLSGALFDIVPGDYTPAAWAFDASSSPIAFGCVPQSVSIEKGKMASIALDLVPR